MDNQSKIMNMSSKFYILISFLLMVIPLYYLSYWVFINYLPETLINVNMRPNALLPNKLPIMLQLLGFVTCLFPLSALIYGLFHIRKLFSFYMKGTIFSFEHVCIFKKIAKALVLWVVLSMLYESVKSVLFSMGNPPGSRVVTVGFTSAEMTTLLVAGMTFIIAWVMDEGRMMDEENKLTV
jgi:Protein of unknown function (DUF2975)